ncbi:aminopeptidase P family N-terminal domain-containing protein [Brevundimonas albigilva]|nr:aminopeptidase P family N-terminal domain-containing protein [Brevundimonas albigilva]
MVPHPDDYSGESHAAKRARIGKAVAKAGADAALLTAPSSIAWLFNVRGGDVIRSPLPIGQALLQADGRARLFLDSAKVTNALPAWLGDEVQIEAPERLAEALDAWPGGG